MKYPMEDDNVFQKWSIVSSRLNPSLKLRIVNYSDQVYYCDVVSNIKMKGKTLSYFERELMQTVA
jgi:hypothetical protein